MPTENKRRKFTAADRGVGRSAMLGLLVGGLIGYAVFLTLAMINDAPAALLPFTGSVHAQVSEADVEPAEAVQEVFRLVSARVLPSIVEVTVKTEGNVEAPGREGLPWQDFFKDPGQTPEGPQRFQSQGLGSGVVVDSRNGFYYVVTNRHVIGESADIRVELQDGSSVDTQLVGIDERKDLALLRFEAAGRIIPAIRVGDSDGLYVGDWVLAFGSPYGYEQSVSSGIVSALGRRDGPDGNINDFIQTDASINQGNSGGALVNIRGELVGINTFITTSNGGSIGLGFAIPVNNVKTSIRQLIETGEVHYGWLGVSLGDYGKEAAESLGYQESSGVLVYQIFRGSPADQAGLLPGDLVLALDGTKSTDTNRLIYRIGDKAPGDIARFTVNRFGKEIELNAVMGKRDSEEAVRSLHGLSFPGFVAAPLVSDLRKMMNLPDDVQGVPVAEVYPRSSAQAVDLRAGDLITAVEGHKISNLEQLYRELAKVKEEVPLFTVYRNGTILELSPSQSPVEDEIFPQ